MANPNHSILTSQVGGHAGGVMTTEDGSLLIKPALQRELEFYQALSRETNLEELRDFTPKFLGTLRLEGQVDPTQTDNAEVVVLPIDDHKVLENLSFPFLKPNILDIKLGTVLYDDTALPEKVARMEKVARDTTSFETGIRLTGFQIYDNITSQPVKTPKAYGKSITPSQLGEGIAKCFPLGASVSQTDAPPPSSSGLPRETLIPMLRAICEEVAIIREILESLELRMVGASLLVIYEADWTRAADAIKLYLAEEEEDEEEDEDSDEDETKLKRPGPPFAVKLIDFAHTTFVPGQGPDRGVLLGMDTLVRLLEARITELSPP